MIRNGIVRCLNALGIVVKEQCFTEFIMKKNRKCFPINLLILTFDMLFFPYEPLCMSSYDAVADYSWSGKIKKTLRSLSQLKSVAITLKGVPMTTWSMSTSIF